MLLEPLSQKIFLTRLKVTLTFLGFSFPHLCAKIRLLISFCNTPELPKVRWVLPDSYLDVRNKDYGGKA